MKRMKKKVVAMVTLAMFMLTLVPMAAFAADENSLVLDESNVEVNIDITVTVNTKDAKDLDNVEIWAEKADVADKAVEDAVFTSGTAAIKGTKNGVASVDTIQDGQTFKIKFPVAGEYNVKVGAWVETKLPGVEELQKEFVEFGTTETITVTGTTVTALSGALSSGDPIPVEYKNGYQLNEVTITAKPGSNTLDNAEVAISNKYESAGIKVVDDKYNAIEKVTLKNGSAKFFVTVEEYTPAGEYLIDLSCNGFDGVATIEVAGDKTEKVATTIKALDVDGVINKADAKYFKEVKLEVRDQNGDLMNPTDLEPIMGDIKGFQHDAYVNVIKQPNKKTLADSEVKLAYDEKTQSVYLDASNNLSDYVAGDYEIEFVLKNGAKATVKFTVGSFNAKDVKDLVIESKEYVIPVTIDNDGKVETEVVPYDVYQVDGNGIKNEITSANIAYVPAVNDVTVTFTNNDFKAEYTGDAEDVIGTKVTVTAYDNVSKKFATKEYTFEQDIDTGLADNKLSIDAVNKEGKVLENNKVVAKLVNKDGDEITTSGNVTVTYTVNETPVKVSNSDAKVIVKDGNNGSFTIYSDKPTTVDVQVLAWYKDTASGNKQAVYGETFSYVIGEGDIVGDTTVVMTFGSTEMIVNNQVVDMKDAAPYVENNRTFVPFRALGEKALGAQVDYNETDKTITFTKGGTEIVMTLDSKDYTVNGEKKTMDVAPFAKENRTYVPVRFVGEALGFDVIALQNGAGAYVGVAFIK